MTRRICKHDRLCALVRNPTYLKDLKIVKNGFNKDIVGDFLTKFGLTFVITPEIVDKYPKHVWETTGVFEDEGSVLLHP